MIPGACMLLKRSVFARAGMFSEDYFMYAEDLDLNYQLKRPGSSTITWAKRRSFITVEE